MKARKQILIGLLSAVALLPATVFLVAGTIFIWGAMMAIASDNFYSSGGSIDYESLYLTLSYIAGVYAIWQFWLLVITTLRNEQYQLSRRFWLAIACGCISVAGATLIGGARTFTVVVLPACILMGWLFVVQRDRAQ